MIACLVKLLVVRDLEVVFIIYNTDPMLLSTIFSQNPHKQIGESREVWMRMARPALLLIGLRHECNPRRR
jgi:formate hydrogenlyase subunit 4